MAKAAVNHKSQWHGDASAQPSNTLRLRSETTHNVATKYDVRTDSRFGLSCLPGGVQVFRPSHTMGLLWQAGSLSNSVEIIMAPQSRASF